MGRAYLFLGAASADGRLLDLLHAPDAERWQQGALVRQEQGEALFVGSKESHLQGRVGRRRIQGRTPGNHRVPSRAAEVPEAGWSYPEGRAPDGPPGNRQDAA